MYVPIIKWRQGEYLALERLEDKIKNEVMPLIEVPPIEWDFARGVLAKTIDDHLSRFAYRFHKKWEGRSAYIDFNLLDPSYRLIGNIHPVTFIFTELSKIGERAIPVTSPYRDLPYQKAIKDIINENEVEKEVCFRLSFKDLIKINISSEVDNLANTLNVKPREINLVIDLDSPNFNPISSFANVLKASVNKFKNIKDFKSLTIVSTAFPKSMGEVQRGSQTVKRSEWDLYLEYYSNLTSNDVTPQFGDYAIAHPVLPQQDMRLLKPAASLRYTIDNAWWIGKGTNVRDNGFEQYRDICKSIVSSPHFCGAKYSRGDAYIKDCSDGTGSTGNLPTWRWVGTNHHITKVVNDLASFGAP